jgi:hypothetical protein
MKKAIIGTGINAAIQFTFDGLDGINFNPMHGTSPAVREYAMLHGFMQRLGDAAAISRTQKDGTVITVTEEMRRNAVLELVTHYESGSESWTTTAAKQPKQNAAILAFATKHGLDYAAAEAKIANMMLDEIK